MATGFESYTVEIDDSGDWDGDTPVIGSGVTGLTVLMVDPIEDCSLTPGDPSPIGRCPKTGDLVYLDRPIDRVRLEAESLLASLRAILPYAESRAEDMLEACGRRREGARALPIAHGKERRRPAMNKRCPKCGSLHPHMHPAIQYEGEVEVCTHDFHLRPTNQNSQKYTDLVLAKRGKISAGRT